MYTSVPLVLLRCMTSWAVAASSADRAAAGAGLSAALLTDAVSSVGSFVLQLSCC